MSKIVTISTIIKQIEHLFEGWNSNEDDNFRSQGFLKQNYSDSEFFVQIYVNTEFINELENNFFPHVELHISLYSSEEKQSRKQVYDCEPFSITDVLNGWYDYDWIREKIDHSQVIPLALDLTNKIRSALSIPSLKQFNEDQSDFWLIY